MAFSTKSGSSPYTLTERMRIDSAGKIKIGNNIPVWSGSYGGGLFLKGNNATGDRYAQLCIVDSAGAIAQQGLKVNNNGSATFGGTGDVTITDGNLVVASGHGIDFSATSNGTGGMTQEILDDYEEGTWTPTIVSYSGTNPTVTGTLGGTYTKIGRKVDIAWYGSTLNVSGTTGNILKFMGLPFPINDSSSCGTWTTHYVNLARPDFGALTNIADGIGVLTSMDGVNQAWAWEYVNIIGTNVSFRASMTYITNS
jgi:hypothetical protein